MTIDELEEQLRQRDALIAEQAARIKELEKQVEQLKKLLVEKAKSKESKPPKEAGNYSVNGRNAKSPNTIKTSIRLLGILWPPRPERAGVAVETVGPYVQATRPTPIRLHGNCAKR